MAGTLGPILTQKRALSRSCQGSESHSLRSRTARAQPASPTLTGLSSAQMVRGAGAEPRAGVTATRGLFQHADAVPGTMRGSDSRNRLPDLFCKLRSLTARHQGLKVKPSRATQGPRQTLHQHIKGLAVGLSGKSLGGSVPTPQARPHTHAHTPMHAHRLLPGSSCPGGRASCLSPGSAPSFPGHSLGTALRSALMAWRLRSGPWLPSQGRFLINQDTSQDVCPS